MKYDRQITFEEKKRQGKFCLCSSVRVAKRSGVTRVCFYAVPNDETFLTRKI